MKESLKKANGMEGIALACTAAGGLALCGGVVASILYVLLTLVLLIPARPAFSQAAPVAAGVRLEAGIEKEDVDGDLRSAMDIYQKIAADTSAPRDVRAKALLRLAGCDEKLGKQAKQVYEQIVHDYADQPAAAQARKWLALLKKQENPAVPTTMNVHKIEWAGLGEMSPRDTDGHRAVYRAADGNLYFGDLTGQNKRLVFKVQPGDVPFWCASRDLSMTALKFPPGPNRPGRLAVIKTDGTGYRELVQDDAQGSILDWSWDTRHLLIAAGLPSGGSRLMIVDVVDGNHHELAQLESAGSTDGAFSPDGRSIAYATVSGTGSKATMRIFVISAEGSQPHQVYESPVNVAEGVPVEGQWRLHDWTADGRYLVISIVYFGKNALYLLPLKNGAPVGNPVLIREGYTVNARSIASGALVFGDRPANSNLWSVFHATLDPDGKLGPWNSLDFRGGNVESNPGFSFSPDGAQIAYISGDEEKRGKDLVLRNLATGQERALYWFSSGRPNCQYAYDQPKVFCFLGWDENGGHSDLVSVATESGALEMLASFSDYRGALTPSQDDQRLYFLAVKAYQGGHYLRWDASDRKDSVLDLVSEHFSEYYVPTPDEHWLIRGDSRGLAIRPMLGGDWKFLVSSADGVLSNVQDFIAHDDWVFFNSKDSEGKLRLYRISILGGDPQFIGECPIRAKTGDSHLRLSRDGHQVIAEIMDESKFNLWTLENFEPPDKK